MFIKILVDIIGVIRCVVYIYIRRYFKNYKVCSVYVSRYYKGYKVCM